MNYTCWNAALIYKIIFEKTFSILLKLFKTYPINNIWMWHFNNEVRKFGSALGQIVQNDILIQILEDFLAAIPNEGQLKCLVVCDSFGQVLALESRLKKLLDFCIRIWCFKTTGGEVRYFVILSPFRHMDSQMAYKYPICSFR